MALLDEWRSQREERQQEVRSRQQEVRSTIASLQEVRLTQGLHDRNWRQQAYINLQQQTQRFLTATSSNRRIQAELLAEKLDEFARSLSLQTAQFLAEITTDREKLATATLKELREFHVNLSATLADLRQQRQNRIEVLKNQTQELLTASYLQRIQTQAQLNRQLTVWMEALRSDIQSYLQELELMGEARRRQLHQSFQESRAQRLVEAQQIRDRHARFQAQLHLYRQNLQFEVWGEHSKMISKSHQQHHQGSKVVSKPVAAEAQIKLDTNVKAQPVEAVKPNMTVLQEQQVYNYIRQGKGARLTEIEAATGLSRVQTVDALRSLLQKGSIVQRDRLYLSVDAVKVPVTITR
ncbi:hypothetical protein [Kamptonema sp. UHCC 0994]|uniref:hypothetical protein n=1 Tax=Kamptonema sp. UHCC 0994 TaxID=3031329 RepID=UPI0023BA10BA|nr:hypothetical protein [Kamptonema sp. UHCC 0994]MDF0554556.1 hypothetical protein [Kamptonema sp. UHCC 0994]